VTSASGEFAGTQAISSWPLQRQPRVTPPSAASSYDPAAERRRAKLIGVIKHLATNPISWTERDPIHIDKLSAETTIGFIYQLPPDRAFPKVAPDGEGGIMLIWDNPPQKELITVDRTTLLLIDNPGQPNSYHFRPRRFDGERIPPIILERLPRR
jgi:hypothetical protein